MKGIEKVFSNMRQGIQKGNVEALLNPFNNLALFFYPR